MRQATEILTFGSDKSRLNTSGLVLISLAAALFIQISCTNRPAQLGTIPATGKVEANSAAQPPAEDGQWPMAAKNYANTRYSGLDEINASNVANLKTAWT